MIIAGAVDPRGAGKWDAIYLGVLFSLLVWLAGGIFWKVRKWMKHGIKLWRERERTPKRNTASASFRPA